MRITTPRVFFLCLLLAAAVLVQAQDVGGVSGTVTDKTSAVVPNAEVTLKEVATNQTLTGKTNAAGQYAFPRVMPGQYTLTVNAPGFATGTVAGLTVSVGKSALANVVLQVGQRTEIVEVQAGTINELQTLDASVGNVINQRTLSNMPNLNRDATTLILLQPGAMPAPGTGGAGTDENVGGQVAGARSDQNTFMVDGGDVTSNTDANSAYSNNFGASPRGAIPTPVESLEEFRVVTNNATGLQRSAGAEVQMVTRRGTNAFHGALYNYMQQDETNANTWERNFLNEAKPELRDNRFGVRVGGPIIKDKTFFFVHWESRHFLRGDNVTRWSPTQNMRNGIIGYKTVPCSVPPAPTDPPTCGTTQYVDLKTLDPRSIGINPTIQQIWNTMPLPNTGTGGDGVNFLNYSAPVSRATNEEFGVARIDQQLGNNWHATASYRYGVTDQTTTNQVLITKDSIKSLSNRPMQPRYLVGGLTGQLTPNVTNDLHFDFLRHFWQWGTAGANPQLPSLGGALQLVNESVTSGAVPYNIDTQQARQRNWNGKDYNLIDNLTWVKGKHLIQVGGRFGWQRLNHLRNDKVTGGMAQPIYYSVWSTGTYFQVGDIPTPADFGWSTTSWNRSYVAALGIISQATQVLTRDGSLSPLPAGQWISQRTATDNMQGSITDTWRVTPSLTLTYGLTYGIQTPPYENSGEQTMMVINGKPFTVAQYLGAKKAAALAGQSYNPEIGFMPIRQLGRKYPFDIDYGNLGPHLAFAWNPSFTSEGVFGKIFGDRKTVIRAGWGRAFDRVNGVDIVMTPALGVGFADLAACKGPTTAGVCAGSTTPTTAFRIGTDGNSIAIPGLASVTAPIVPGVNAAYAVRDWHIDPGKKIGSTDMFDLSIQREMPGRMLMEVGFIGRLSHHLYQKVDLNQIPYMYTRGGQTFASAFDALQVATNNAANVLQSGPGKGKFDLSKFAAVPFFESALGGSTSPYCTGVQAKTGFVYQNCTQAVVDNEGGNISGRDAWDTFADLDPNWVSGSFLPATNQVFTLDTTVSNGQATYAGGFVSLRKALSHGVSFDVNYTYSKSLDELAWNQDIIDTLPDGYDPKRTYGASQFDRKHVINAIATFDLPFGKGRNFAPSSGFLDKLVGGWSTSYIFSAASGLPLQIYSGSSCGVEYGDGGYAADCVSMVPVKPSSVTSTRNNNPTLQFVTDPTTGKKTCTGFGCDSEGGYPNAFGDPNAVGSNFRAPLFADSRVGVNGAIRGLGFWNVDFSLAKTTHITERVTTRFEMQVINLFNHPVFSNPNTDISSSSDFGVLNQQNNAARWIQWGLRFDF